MPCPCSLFGYAVSIPCAAENTTVLPEGTPCAAFIAMPRAEVIILPSRRAPLKQASKNTDMRFAGMAPSSRYNAANSYPVETSVP